MPAEIGLDRFDDKFDGLEDRRRVSVADGMIHMLSRKWKSVMRWCSSRFFCRYQREAQFSCSHDKLQVRLEFRPSDVSDDT